MVSSPVRIPVFSKISARAQDRHLDIARVGGEHDDVSVGELRAVQVRHLEVHPGDVGAERPEPFDPFAAVGGLADECDVGSVSEERRDTFPQERVVIDRQYANVEGVLAHCVGSRMALKTAL